MDRMARGNSSSSDVENNRRRNQPRGGSGRYKWSMQPHHSIQWQKEWLNLATKLFNIDENDILLTSSEKNEVLRLLANRITDSNISEYSRAVGSCKIVETVRKMCAGKTHPVEVNIYTALLRYSLKPPVAWLEKEMVLQRWNALKYLERCADGTEKYSSEAMKDAMPKNLAALADIKQQDDATRALENPFYLVNSFFQPFWAKEHTIPAARPWTRAVTNLVSPKQPSNKRKAASELSPEEKAPPSKKLAEPKKKTTPKRTATPKKRAVNIVIKNSSGKHKSPAQVQDETDSPTSSLRRARRNPGTTTGCLDRGVDSVVLARIFKTSEVLDKVARYEEACVRQVALSNFITDLQEAGWSDLEKSAKQLIKDENRDSRVFLTGMIVSGSYEKINEALEKTSEATETDCRNEPASGRRGPRILFRSG
ncbi:hypothetical protein LZ30DRAFT_813524 [Colletotrichum cereale]|nr:hypothetical protein LZ30DRAFT_813524 [Colletotrichum cereale]